ncbi:HAD family hydrolase [Salinarchaeum sp. IM2453]|uniref:HAD family hydrolase n=1 Tax=Salinarchaeum sp. IM2453 TaxID=2862870 RepID=UPI001C83E579|nr:HAD family hydrolase [Salinarchaeum sp. IM2453]QZA87704.1 HAD family hydrolase [Salinarchaeum sp. IM2453]
MTKSTEYDFWLFDLDGTLVDVEWSYIRSVFDRLEQSLDATFSDEQARILWRGLTGSRNQYISELGVDVEQFWDALHQAEDPQERAEATYLHPDARVVTEIKEPVGIVTHCQPYLTEPVLEHLDIRDWFDAVVCCSDSLGWKPDPAPVEYTMDQLGVNSQNGILIGDSACDIGAAWNAGIEAGHIERLNSDFRGGRVVADYQMRQLSTLREQSRITAD